MTSSDSLRDRLTEKTGIQLTRGGLSDSLRNFIERRLKELSLKDEPAYLSHLDNDPSGESERLIDVISVPHTWFFRDSVQLNAIIDALSAVDTRRRPLRVWVPGCATGEDAYSLALLARAAGLELEVTASDLSRKSLQRAEEAVFGPFSLRELPPPFWSELESIGKAHRVKEGIRRMVNFREHNLMHPPLRTPGGWDAILCRNVFIYFSSDDAARCAEELAKVLHVGGTLFWGAGELMTEKPRGIYPVSIRDRIAFRRLQGGPQSPAALSASQALLDPRRTAAQTLHAPNKAHPAPPLQELEPPHPAPNWDELLARADVADATREVLRISAETPLDPALRMAGGIFLYSSGDYQCALREFRTALVLDASLWPATLYEGLCLEGLGLREEALSSYRAAEASLASRSDAATLPAVLKGLDSELRDMVKLKARAQV